MERIVVRVEERPERVEQEGGVVGLAPQRVELAPLGEDDLAQLLGTGEVDVVLVSARRQWRRS